MPGSLGEAWKQVLSDAQGEGKTTPDDVRQSPTTSDNASGPPTTSDDVSMVSATVRLAAWQKKRLQEIARRDGRLFSDVVREALRDYLRGR